MSRRAIVVFVMALLLALLVKAFAYYRTFYTADTYLRLVTASTNCFVHINGIEVPEIRTLPAITHGDRIGLYLFHSFETPDREQAFKSLETGWLTTNGYRAISLALNEPKTAGDVFELPGGWIVDAGT
ncbi:MAG: hypothetical protein C0404_13600, partial [Verrucomicrobia bacterium]|nr:hypothetical protein [Verrucomicrobiota bacterium]